MERSVFLFLFFFFYFLGIGVFDFPLVYSQDSGDSLRFYHDVIINPKNQVKVNSAFSFFEKEIQKNMMESDTLSAVQNLRRVAIGQFEMGFLYESEITAVDALTLLDGLTGSDVEEAKRGLYNHLGLVYRLLKSYPKAIIYYNQALAYTSNVSDSISTMHNISILHLDQKGYGLAVDGFSWVYEKRKKENNPLKLARALDNLGYAQTKLNLSEALPNMMQALRARKKMNDRLGQYSSHVHLTNYFKDRGEEGKALENAQKAYEISKEVNSASYIENALSLLLNLSKDSLVLEYKRINDSIAFAKQIQENKYATIKYNIDKEKKKTQTAQLQNEKQKGQITIILSVLLLVLLFLGFIIVFKNQQRKRERIEASQKTEARLSKKIHDELANDISGVMAYVDSNFDSSKTIKNKLLDYLNDIYLRTRDISTEISSVDVEDFPSSIRNLIAQYQKENTRIITNPVDTIDWNKVANFKRIAVYRCLQELLVNTKKHSQATEVSLAFTRKGKKHEIVYTDNGIGFDAQSINQSGLANVETRINGITGTFSFDSSKGNGFNAKLTF